MNRLKKLAAAAGIAAVLFVIGAVHDAAASNRLKQISEDKFTNSGAQHKTEVESDNFAFGNTMVGAFQVGRYPDSNAGSTDIGFATTTDGGKKWKYGYLPGISKTQNPNNPFDRVTDPAVAYDVKHGVWLIVSLPYSSTYGTYVVPIVSSSKDGLNWNGPVQVASVNGDFMDKPWIACDDTKSSPYYGNCYVEYVDVNFGLLFFFTTSSDGGKTWSSPVESADGSAGSGGQPVVQPNGTVVMPYLGSGIESISSTNGGGSWNASVFAAGVSEVGLPAGLRDPGPLPSADVDANGNVYVAWWDCSFHTNCSSNDAVYVTSPDGKTWSAVQRIPTMKQNNPQDDFLIGIGIDHSTGGRNAHIAVVYYYLANANCSVSTCQIYAGFIGSTNGGSTWNRPTELAGPMQVTWLPQSDLGYMIGDYSSTSVLDGLANTTLVIASQPKGGSFEQAMYAPPRGLPMLRDYIQLSTAGERPFVQAPRFAPHRIPIII